MKIEILKERDDFIEISMLEEDQSIFDALSEILQSIDGVEYAGHRLLHPLTGEVRLIVKTKAEKIKAREALVKALERINKLIEEIFYTVEKV